MKLPIDIADVLLAALDIEKARTVPVSVNILIDETVSAEFQAFVRAGFNSEAPNSRVMVSYFPTQRPDPAVACDLAIIAAGRSDEVPALAAAFEQAGTPVLVVAQDGEGIRERAERAGHALSADAVVCPQPGEAFGDEIRGQLADRIGSWIAEKCPEKRLAFSVAYPFVRRPLALHAVKTTSWQNAGVGVVVFVPGADMPIMTANQAKMVLQIAAAYGQPLGPERVKELAFVLLNGFVWRGIARQVAGVVPALGWAVKGSLGFAGTQAIGHAAIEYFEGGGDVAGLASVVGRTTKTVSEARETVCNDPSFRSFASHAVPLAKKLAGTALEAAAPVAKSAASTAVRGIKPALKQRVRRRSGN